jgi:hypothetical protein
MDAADQAHHPTHRQHLRYESDCESDLINTPAMRAVLTPSTAMYQTGGVLVFLKCALNVP